MSDMFSVLFPIRSWTNGRQIGIKMNKHEEVLAFVEQFEDKQSLKWLQWLKAF
jgi:hypothetical protein